MAPNDTRALAHLTLAEEQIADAKALIARAPEPPARLVVAVLPGDNLLQLIADHPEGTIFDIADDFIQHVGDVELPKPCTLRSGGHGTLIGALYVQPRTHFIGLTIDGATTNTILTAADDTTVDRCTLNGNAGGQHRGILANCRGVRVRNTQILNIAKDIDSQAIAGWNKTNDLQILNCVLEASGENILLGGADSVDEASMPRNVLIAGNHLTKRVEWRAGVATCKNLLEFKAASDVIVRENTMDYSFVDGQIGFAILLTVRNNDGTAPWSTIRNCLFENNLIRHTAGGLSIMGRDDRPGFTSQVLKNVTFRNNRFEDMSWDYGGNGREIIISWGSEELTFDGNEFHCTTLPQGTYFDVPQHLHHNLVFRNQKQLVEGEYGLCGTSAPSLGKAALEMYAPGYTWEANHVLRSGVRNIDWPAGTIFLN